MNTYECFWNGKRITVEAPTSYVAQQKAGAHWKLKPKPYEISVVLAAKEDGKPVIHSGAELP